ncbi:MAG: Ig-like domain-containing protein [Lachnospiraceae bacterium]|nr:Ig-like domain-containing protein [Lachnospiraceae bacterium]
MKRKQLAAIALSAILSFSACIPATGFGVYAAENDATTEFAVLGTVEEGGSDETAEAEAAGQADESVLENAGEALDSLPEAAEETAEQPNENLAEISQEDSQDAIQEDSQDAIQEDSQEVSQEDSQDVIQEKAEDSVQAAQDSAQDNILDSAQEVFDIQPGDTLTGTDPAEDAAAEETETATKADAPADTEAASGNNAASDTAADTAAPAATDAAAPTAMEAPSGNDAAVEGNDAAVEGNDAAVETNDAAVENNEAAVPDGSAAAQDDLDAVTEEGRQEGGQEGGQQEDVSEEAAGFVEEPGSDELDYASEISLGDAADANADSGSEFYVYPEGGDRDIWSIDVDITGRDSVTLRTVVDTDGSTEGMTYKWEAKKYLDSDITELSDVQGDTCEVIMPQKGEYFCTVTDAEGHSGTARFCLIMERGFSVFGYDRYGSQAYDGKITYDADDNDGPVELMIGVDAGVTDRLSYQWYKDTGSGEELIDGAVAPEYTVDNPVNGTAYTCIVDYGYGDEPKALTYLFRHFNCLYVYADTERLVEAVTYDPREAESFTLSPYVTADDMEGLTYEWKKGHGSDGIYTPTGDTSPSLTVNSPADEDVYTCTVTDRYGNQGTGWFYFYADTHLRIYAAEDPSKQYLYYIDITGKETLTLNAVAEADEGTPLSYHWNRVDVCGDNYNIDGASGELTSGGTIALQLDTLEAGTTYLCVIQDNYGHLDSLEIHLVSGTPALNIYPGGASEGEDTAVVNVGYGEASVELAVNSVTDSEGFYYTWKNAAGETVYSEYNVPNYYAEQPKEGERYSCTVTDRFGQEATVWFELHLEANPDNPTEEEMAGAAVIRAGESVHVDVEPESRGEFFKFIPEKTCVYTLTSTFDENENGNTLRLELYDSDYNPVAADREDDYFNSQTLYTFLAGEGETCYLRARSEDDFSAGSYTLSLAENAAFCAYGSDMVRQISPGEETSFEVTAWSPAALHYQWYYSTESEYYGEEETPEIPGATGTSYTPANPLTGYYTCKVWDDGGQSKDLNFNLTVDNHLYVENSYSEISCQAGEPAVLTVNASADDTEGLVYTWQKYDSAGNVWVDIQGISGNSYTIPEAEESTEYRIRVTDRYNNSYDATIQVSVDNQFSATYVLHDGQEVVDGVPTVTLYANGSLDTVLEVAVQGADTDGITYEWGCKSGDQSTITLEEKSSTCRPQYDGYYFCRVTDRFGNTREVTFRVIIVNDPHFTNTDDTELEYAGGEPTTLKVGAAALNQDSLRYLWYKCVDTYDTIFLGETSENYLDVTPEEDEERYFCCLTDIYRHYDDSSQVNFIVRKKTLTNLADAQLTVAASGLTYNGKEHKPAVTVKYDGQTLVAGRDYKAAYENNKDAGTARVIVTGIGNYTGTAEKTFSIAKASQTLQADNLSVVFAAKKAVSVTGAQGKVTYTSDKPAVAAVDADGNVTGKAVGSAKVTISAEGNKNYLTAKKVITATVTAAALKAGNVTVAASGLTYNGKEKKPAVTVKFAGKTLTENTDYKVAYKNNINAGTDTASVTVTGLGNYKASVTKTFSIAKAGQTLTIAAVKVAVGKTAAISVTGAKGTKSFNSANTAIATVNSTTGVVTGKKVGTVKITVTSKATSNYKAASKAVTVTVLPAATSKISASNLVTGIKVTWNKVTGASGYTLYRNGTRIAILTGNAKVTYTDSGANTNGAKYVYKVVARAVIGSSTLNSTASRSLTTYRVARPAVSSLTNSAASKMTVKWAKNAKANGYQIQYSTDSTFKSGVKTVTISSAATVSKVIASLTKTKTYCVRMRTFKTVSATRYYSAWSAVKKLKITK